MLFATSRQGLIDKLNALTEWCDHSGMVINEDKTEFMAICSDNPADKLPILIYPEAGQVSVNHCSSYTYLGAIFTSDAKVSTTLSHHITSRCKSMNKLTIFLCRNACIPYVVKKKVLDACFNTSLLYGCEGWLGIKPTAEINAFYMKGIKLLLGVRHSSPNDACLVESGYPSLEAIIRSRQKDFFTKMEQERSEMTDDPLMFAIALTCEHNKTMRNYIDGLKAAGDIIGEDVAARCARLRDGDGTRAVTYRNINPDLALHPVYDAASRLDDDLRIVFTRFRLASHRLRIETGRWARIPAEERFCQCDTGAVQSEKHVLVECPLVNDIRAKYDAGNIDFRVFMNSEKSVADLKCLKMLREIMHFFE